MGVKAKEILKILVLKVVAVAYEPVVTYKRFKI